MDRDPLNKIDQQQLRELGGRFGLPLHIVFPERFRANADAFKEVAARHYPGTAVHFAVKSNPCRGAVRLALDCGLGVDVVSEYELRAALEEGATGERIVCHGNAKTDEYYRMAVEEGAMISIGADWELDLLERRFAASPHRPKLLLRFSGMPLEGLTAADQSTASAWTKFGFPVDRADEVIERARELQSCDVMGISAHIGTQICDEVGYERLVHYLLDLAGKLPNCRVICLGGGFPVNYVSGGWWREFQDRLWKQLNEGLDSKDWVTWDGIPMGFAPGEEPPLTPPLLRRGGSGDSALIRRGGRGEAGSADFSRQWRGKAYWSEYPGAAMLEHLLQHKFDDGSTVAEQLQSLGSPRLLIEPGRSLIGTAGITVAEVMGVKEVMGNPVVSLDMGVVNHGTNLVTPDIFPMDALPRSDDDEPTEAFIAGRLCFTGDMISKVKVPLNRLPERGDLLVIHHTGAYSADHFASNSCGFPRPAKVALHPDGSLELWRRADTFAEVFPSP